MLPLHALLTLLLIATPSVNSAHVNLYADPAYSSLYPDSTVYSMGTISQNSTMTFANFEIELQWTDVIPYLYSESGIDVLGNVQQTPRYNTSGEAWVDGVQVDFTFYDATLVDRFVINCTSEKAINMSSYTWVEWTAPILEGTIYSQLPPDEELGIFFEYGAESGVLQPPFDWVGPFPSSSGSYTMIDTTHVRSGSYSIKNYQVPPTKSDGQRRISTKIKGYSHEQYEFYLSWWVYFDGRWSISDTDGWGSTLGGYQQFFGPSDWKWKWWVGGRFHIAPWSRTVTFTWGCGKASGVEDYSTEAEYYEDNPDFKSTAYKITDYLNQWVHFQLYVKYANDTSGVTTAWFNNNLIYNNTLKTDPRGYSEWVNAGYFADSKYPNLVFELYQDTDSFESWNWYDDIVAAAKKVPEAYKVNT